MGGDRQIYGWTPGEIDRVVPEFPEKFSQVNPKHPAWKTRVKWEVQAIMKFLQYLKRKGSRPWFQLMPTENPKFNFMVWKGQLHVPTRKDISFGIRVLLTSEYPVAPPRCFAAKRILCYADKIYTKNIWTDPETKGQYVMICHDHMKDPNLWNNKLGIVHFFVREVWYWWGAQQNFIIKEYDKRKAAGNLI
ncbi:MAG: hypothetical protein ACTSU5_14305 [Promethearchaeota archaeon]